MKKKITYNQHETGVLFDRADYYPGDIPSKPGVYVFRNRFSKIIYVGKASNLRKRMSSYFQPSRLNTADPKSRSLINSIAFFEFYIVSSESESLVLESRFIKEYAPRYNVLMRDDKRFLLVKINIDEKYPSLSLARVRKNDGSKYFGPFPKTGALRKTVEYLVKRFGLRVCKSSVPTETDRKYCLARIVKDCSAPCINKVSREQYLEQVDALMDVINGNISGVIDEIKQKMLVAVNKRQYEKAAEYRDMATNIEEIFGGRRRNFRFAKLAGVKDPEKAIEDLREVLGLTNKITLIECFDISNIGGSLAVAAKVCFINGTPDKSRYRRYRIRGISPEQVLSGVDDNMPILDYPLGYGGDDFAMIAEAVARAYKNKVNTDDMPDLIIIDGGRGQLNSALKALKIINSSFVPVIGLAKKNEEIIIPGKNLSLILDKRTLALKLLQEIRDETHRFAISYHRALRSERIEESLLDDITGIGASRRKALLTAFGSVKKLKKASVQKICDNVPGIGRVLAENILNHLHSRP